MATETGFLPYCLVKCITCLLDQGLTLSPLEKLSGVPLNILSSVLVNCLFKKIFKSYVRCSKHCVKRPLKNRQNKDLNHKW